MDVIDRAEQEPEPISGARCLELLGDDAGLARLQAAALFNYLARSESADERVVSLNFASWNRVVSWLRQLEVIRAAA